MQERLTDANSWVVNISRIIAILFALFHLYTAATIPLAAVIQRSIHLGFAGILVFLLFPFRTRSGGTLLILDICLSIIALTSSFYVAKNYNDIAFRAGTVTIFDIIFGILMVIIVLEGTRRVLGPAMPVIALIFLMYARFGYLLPGQLGHKGYDIERIINTMYLSTEGIWGTPLGVSATYVAVFVIFGVILQKIGGGEFYISASHCLIRAR